MLLEVLIFVAGLTLLSLGAKWLVDGSAELTLGLGIRPVIVGMSVVAFGTSMPEFVFNLAATINNTQDLGLGNIVGSNIANIALVLGVSAMIKPIVIDQKVVRKELPITIGATLLFLFMALDGEINQIDGAIMCVLFVGFFVYLIKNGQDFKDQIDLDVELDAKALKDEENRENERKAKLPKQIFLIVVGLVGLISGAQLMVDSSVTIARQLDISELVIGMTVVAIGTSLPELAASITSAFKSEGDLSLGNVLGSNIFNILMVIGILSVISPIAASGTYTISLHFTFMTALTLLLWPVLHFSNVITRVHGFILFAIYVTYLILSYTYS